MTKASSALASASYPLKCGVGIHPSLQVESAVHGDDESAMIDSIRIPILFLTAGDDDDRLKPGGVYARAVEREGGRCVNFPEMRHGWTTRGDLGVPGVRRDAELALTLAVDFLGKNL